MNATQPDYRADAVDAKETAAMQIFKLAFMDAGLSRVDHSLFAFNIVAMDGGKRYRVQAGYVNGNGFRRVGETTPIRMPEGKDLVAVAQDELRHPGEAVNLFLNGQLHRALKVQP